MTHLIFISADPTGTPAPEAGKSCSKPVVTVLSQGNKVNKEMGTFNWFHHINLKYFHESVIYNVRSQKKHSGNALLAKLQLYNDKYTIIVHVQDHRLEEVHSECT